MILKSCTGEKCKVRGWYIIRSELLGRWWQLLGSGKGIRNPEESSLVLAKGGGKYSLNIFHRFGLLVIAGGGRHFDIQNGVRLFVKREVNSM